MTSITQRLNSAIRLSLSWAALELARLIKFSIAIGTGHAFSVVTIVAPFVSLRSVLFSMCGKALYTYFFGIHWAFALAFRLPTLAGVVAYKASSGRANALFFVAAIGLFIANPVGAQAWAYALVWVIPTVAILLAPRTQLTRALTSTFAAHAAGTLIHLHLSPISAATWIALIPAVLVERALLTIGLLAMGTVVSYMRERLPEIKNAFALVK